MLWTHPAGPGGCSLGQEQTHKSIMKCLIVETYELAEAIEDDNIEDMKEERRTYAGGVCQRHCQRQPPVHS
ncbi:MAG: MazG nucleotide pyrophosphohydrolase domain-containing protein [Desulfobacterales bacterium]